MDLGTIVKGLDIGTNIIGGGVVGSVIAVVGMKSNKVKKYGEIVGTILATLFKQKVESTANRYATTVRDFSEGLIIGLKKMRGKTD